MPVAGNFQRILESWIPGILFFNPRFFTLCFKFSPGVFHCQEKERNISQQVECRGFRIVPAVPVITASRFSVGVLLHPLISTLPTNMATIVPNTSGVLNLTPYSTPHVHTIPNTSHHSQTTGLLGGRASRSCFGCDEMVCSRYDGRRCTKCQKKEADEK